MLRVRNISLTHFKNYSHRKFQFSGRISGICGNNGVGKTNLLDAIHYCCFTKSYFARDSLSVQEGKSGFRIEAEISLLDKTETVVCILRETGKKEFLVNALPYEKLSLHIGHFPCVVIAPDDSVLITGGSEERRKFLDALLSQVDPQYLQQLINYNKILLQRNSLLRSLYESGSRSARPDGDFSLLDAFDEQIRQPCGYIFNKRKEFLVEFLPAVRRKYQEISQQPEDLKLFYESQLLHGDFNELIQASRQKDIQLQRTTIGIHRDELEFQLGEQLFRNIASQGQRKSLLFALKLTEMDVLSKTKGFAPILLLDDVFEKLDEGRIGNLLQRVCVENDGQVFITDTNEERLVSHLKQIGVEFQLIKL